MTLYKKAATKELFIKLMGLATGATTAGWISTLARVIGVALIIPIAFRKLTLEDTVLWLFFTTAINFQAILDFGHNTTFGRYIAYARATNNNVKSLIEAPRIESLLHIIGPSYFRMTLGMSLIVIPILSYMVATPIGASTQQFAHWFAWAILCVSLVIQTYAGRFIATLQGFEHVATQRWIEAGIGVAANGLAGAFLWADGKLISAALSTAIVGIFGASIYGFAAKQVLRKRSKKFEALRPPDSELKLARQVIWSSAWRSGIGILFSTGLIQFLSITVSNIAPAAQASSFMFATRIAQVISTLSQSPFYSYLPTLARKFKEHALGEIQSEARSRMSAASLIVAAGFIGAGIFLPTFLRVTDSQTVFVSNSIWLAMGFGYLAERIGAMHMQLYTLSGKVIWHWVNGGTGIAFIIGAWLLFKKFELLAIPISMFISYTTVYCAIAIQRSYKLLNLRLWDFDLIATIPAALLLSAYGIATLFFK